MARSGTPDSGAAPAILAWVRKIPRTAWSLLTQTVGTCLRYRVTGLAAEGAFFAILSLPPLIFGLAGSIGYIADKWFEVETIENIKDQIAQLAARALTDDSVESVIVPTLDKVLDGGRPDVISIGFVLALWSGSRALNVFVDTITIMYGLGGRRGIVRTRALSFSLYCVALVIGVIVLPLVLAGPQAVEELLPTRLDFLNQLYWPVVTILSAGFLNTLYHLSVPVRTPWVSDLPGSFFALSLWILGSFILRWTLQSTVGGTSIYGPLAAPIAVLLWLYLTAIAVLIGAALNSVVDRRWPHKNRVKDAAETAMKAESDPHHSEPETDDERPEVRAARAIESLGEPLPPPGTPPAEPAAEPADRPAGRPAAEPPAAGPAAARAAARAAAQAPERASAPASAESGPEPGPAKPPPTLTPVTPPDPVVKVGKSGARGETDDLG